MAPDGASPESGAFDPSASDWVLVDGAGFVFEPWGAEFRPTESGRILVAFGGDATRHRGVEVYLLNDRWVSIWMPTQSEAFWLPDTESDRPWETRLVPLDYERGTVL
jgi:hypothetical protein